MTNAETSNDIDAKGTIQTIVGLGVTAIGLAGLESESLIRASHNFYPYANSFGRSLQFIDVLPDINYKFTLLAAAVTLAGIYSAIRGTTRLANQSY